MSNSFINNLSSALCGTSYYPTDQQKETANKLFQEFLDECNAKCDECNENDDEVKDKTLNYEPSSISIKVGSIEVTQVGRMFKVFVDGVEIKNITELKFIWDVCSVSRLEIKKLVL